MAFHFLAVRTVVGENVSEVFFSCPPSGRGKYFGGFFSCLHGGRGKYFGGFLSCPHGGRGKYFGGAF